MKNTIRIVAAFLLIIIALNILLLYHFRNNQVQFHEDFLFHQTQLCGNYIENTISSYENELTRIIFQNNQNLHLIFTDKKITSGILEELKKFYAKYRHLLSNIAIYDNTVNYLGIYIKDNDEFVVDTFSRQRVNVLESKELIIEKNGKYLSFFPFYKNNVLVGNIVAEINLNKFFVSVFNLFYHENIQWQWILNTNSKILFSSAKYTDINMLDSISNEISNENEGVIIHEVNELNSGKRRIISAYYPLAILNHDISLVFSTFMDRLITPFFRNYRFLILADLILFLFLFIVGSVLLRREIKKNEILSFNLLSQKMIVEHFPVGILILDKNGVITNINITAQKMLLLDNHFDIIGKNFSDHFLVSNKYLLKDTVNLPLDNNHFLLYEKDGNEIVIYRKEVKTYIAGEELTISALIDVSPFEKSRKQEIAANMAKSEFLAKMSHEIRTPMNGIIGVAENLLRSDLTDEKKEEVKIIKKSSALLMNIINDILDFSKIEAGKMMLEEIPFNLQDELNLIQDLYKTLADEKSIELKLVVKPNVPLNLIGDPFRLRQVLTNLLSNAIKFTENGIILISVDMIDSHNSSLTLLFSVEDTGIGISRENISKLFKSYEQVNSSTSRIYGGSGLGMSIARQLVEMMNGEIWVESPSSLSNNPESPGSKFSFTVEMYSNEKLRKKYDFSKITHYHQISALILSKTRDESDRMHSILDSFGINFNYLLYDDENLNDVLVHIEEKRNIYQIIVIKDKPDNEGFTLSKKFRDKKIMDNYLVIMVSSNDKQGNYHRTRNLGIDYYLIQPYESNEVFKILQDNFPDIPVKISVESQISQIRPSLKILVADDNIINQRVIRAIFKHLGYEISIAVNGAEALKMTKENNFDILFMDLLMPEMDGCTATQEIRKFNTTLPVIALSAADDQSYINDALKAGMNEFLAKPVKLEAVKQLLIKLFSESL